MYTGRQCSDVVKHVNWLSGVLKLSGNKQRFSPSRRKYLRHYSENINNQPIACDASWKMAVYNNGSIQWIQNRFFKHPFAVQRDTLKSVLDAKVWAKEHIISKWQWLNERAPEQTKLRTLLSGTKCLPKLEYRPWGTSLVDNVNNRGIFCVTMWVLVISSWLYSLICFYRSKTPRYA